MLVSLTLARAEVPVPVALRLFLPDDWAGDAKRCRRAGVPQEWACTRTKPAIALAELDRLRGLGVQFGTVLALPAVRQAILAQIQATAPDRCPCCRSWLIPHRQQ